MIQVQNPIARGFRPDPSVVRVEEDFYLATSTFEWFPGGRLHADFDYLDVARPEGQP